MRMHRIAELLFYCSVGNLKAVKKLVRRRCFGARGSPAKPLTRAARPARLWRARRAGREGEDRPEERGGLGGLRPAHAAAPGRQARPTPRGAGGCASPRAPAAR